MRTLCSMKRLLSLQLKSRERLKDTWILGNTVVTLQRNLKVRDGWLVYPEAERGRKGFIGGALELSVVRAKNTGGSFLGPDGFKRATSRANMSQQKEVGGPVGCLGWRKECGTC